MKITVNRQLSNGIYLVYFAVTDFTQEDLEKLGKFGIPQIRLSWGGIPPTGGTIPLNQIGKVYTASFRNEADAKNYEKIVIDQIRAAVQNLRDRQDKFTGSEEVPL